MSLNRAWLLALLALGACGGPAEQTAEPDPAAELPGAAAERDALEPELVATDAAGSPTTGRFELGQHYLRLSPTQPTSSNPDQVEVCEVFWYGCPHCYELDPLLERWREQAPDYVNFVRVPAVWNPTLQIHARAFYTAEALGKGAEMHSEFFREIHENGATGSTPRRSSRSSSAGSTSTPPHSKPHSTRSPCRPSCSAQTS